MPSTTSLKLLGRAGILGRGERALRQALLRGLEKLTALPNDGVPPALPRRILLLRMDRIGDMIVSTPAIHAIRRRFPEAELHVVASRSNAQILRGNPDVDAVHPYSRGGLLALVRTLARKKWDVVADLNTGPSLTSGLLARLLPAGVRVSFEKEHAASFYNARLAPNDRSHRAVETMRIARWLGAAGDDLRYRLHPSAHDEKAAEEALLAAGWRPDRRWVAVHPGNIKKFDNRWPEEKFAALCDLIETRTEAKVLLLQGFDEAPLIERVRAAASSSLAAAAPLELLPTAALLKRMALVICNSTSTLHLAAAAGAPTLSFLGGYCAACWNALGPGHRQLVSSEWNSCRDIGVEPAWAAVRELL